MITKEFLEEEKEKISKQIEEIKAQLTEHNSEMQRLSRLLLVSEGALMQLDATVIKFDEEEK